MTSLKAAMDFSHPPSSNRSVMAGWDARLELAFASRLGQTRLTKRRYQGPLLVQKILYPEGRDIAHGLIIHPPGGVAGGDSLRLNIDMATESAALLTMPGAAKWYKSAGKRADQTIKIGVANAAMLEWLPQENIVFDGANIDLQTDIALDDGAVYAGWDIVCLGRQARNEDWTKGRVYQRLSIKRDAELIWQESALFTPDSPIMHSIAGLHGQRVYGSFVVAAGNVPAEILQQCQAVTAPSSAFTGVSALPEIFTARYLGQSSQQAKSYFQSLWAILRPWYGKRSAQPPRIWAT